MLLQHYVVLDEAFFQEPFLFVVFPEGCLDRRGLPRALLCHRRVALRRRAGGPLLCGCPHVRACMNNVNPEKTKLYHRYYIGEILKSYLFSPPPYGVGT